MPDTICIPATPPVDVGRFLPVIDHPLFQNLRERKQLGINYLVFPGAVHTRFEHALGVLALAQRICRIQSWLSEHDQLLLQLFALVHDIGHGPMSHQIEPVLSNQNHHTIGVKRIQQMGKAIRECGAEPEELIAMLTGKNPLALWITDRNLGADKLDYLMRDALHIGFHGTPDIERIQFNTVWRNNALAIESGYTEEAKQLQKFYSYLHQHGYLNSTALIAQRMLQRAIYEELQYTQTSGDALWDMTDSQLREWLHRVKSPLARHLSRLLETRSLHVCFLAIKPAGYAYEEQQEEEIALRYVQEWPRALLDKFCNAVKTQDAQRNMEDTLAHTFGFRPGDILCAPMPYFRKLLPKDLRVYSRHTQADVSLLEKDGAQRRSLESDYLRTFAIRFTAPESIRLKLAHNAPQIAENLSRAL